MLLEVMSTCKPMSTDLCSENDGSRHGNLLDISASNASGVQTSYKSGQSSQEGLIPKVADTLDVIKPFSGDSAHTETDSFLPRSSIAL